MELGDFIYAAGQGIEVAMWVSAPVLIMGLIAGFAISVFQAATQINDQALAFIPKIGAVVLALILFGTFMISRIADFTTWAFNQIPLVSQ